MANYLTDKQIDDILAGVLIVCDLCPRPHGQCDCSEAIDQVVAEKLRRENIKLGINEYTVVCDESNNGFDVVNQNELRVDVYVPMPKMYVASIPLPPSMTKDVAQTLVDKLNKEYLDGIQHVQHSGSQGQESSSS